MEIRLQGPFQSNIDKVGKWKRESLYTIKGKISAGFLSNAIF